MVYSDFLFPGELNPVWYPWLWGEKGWHPWSPAPPTGSGSLRGCPHRGILGNGEFDPRNWNVPHIIKKIKLEEVMLWIHLCFFFFSFLTAHWTIAERWEWPKRKPSRWTVLCPEQRGGYQMVCVLAVSLWLSSIIPTLMSLSCESLTGQ